MLSASLRPRMELMNDAIAEAFDPITLEIYWNRLISAADESAAGLLRTAFSTIVRESNDFATVLMDRNGDSVSENTGGLASFSCILPRTTKEFLRRVPAEAWKPGDTMITTIPGSPPGICRISPLSPGFFITARWSASPAPSPIRPISAARCGPPIAARFLRKGF